MGVTLLIVENLFSGLVYHHLEEMLPEVEAVIPTTDDRYQISLEAFIMKSIDDHDEVKVEY